ncbi:low molecular weight phosphatase family protein [Mycolicibacterium litorale]|uniref:arsenate reductase/protein-tyrosine-phosphatase family protein n=1 Tax=Mycolicibacterium litorale TaxID=758802 RepID=UPI003CF84EDA
MIYLTTKLGAALHLLFVCTGNICRSPMAERLAAAHFAEAGLSGFVMSSAGTRAVVGHPIHDLAAEVLRDLGGETSLFAARQVTPKIASSADLVITMTRRHRDLVLELAPRQLKRTFTLGEASQLASRFAPQDITELATLRPRLTADQISDIPDPIGQAPEIFAKVGQQISGLLPPLIELCRISSVK